MTISNNNNLIQTDPFKSTKNNGLSQLKSTDLNLKNNTSSNNLVGALAQTNGIQKEGIELKLDELNKQKVTVEVLEKTVSDIKKPRESQSLESSKSSIIENEVASRKKKKKKPLIVDVRDTNRDGKVSLKEKLKAEEKKALSLVKDIVDELKKEDKFDDIKVEEFRGISKMLNNDIIKPSGASNINKFLEA